MQGDLHTHTYVSDGSCSAKSIIEHAAMISLKYISITDHDNFTVTEQLQDFALNLGVKLIDGVEISCNDLLHDRKVHILCYLPKNRKPIKELCEHTIKLRAEAGIEMATHVSKMYPVTLNEITDIARNSTGIYKQHIMQALMNAGITTEIYGKLFNKLFDTKTGSCIVNFSQPDVYKVIDHVKAGGGVCVMAHPYTYDSIDLLLELCEKRLLDGIEVRSCKSNSLQEEYLSSIADRYNLIKTGGSDFHGAFGSKVSPLGSKLTGEKAIKLIFGGI